MKKILAVFSGVMAMVLLAANAPAGDEKNNYFFFKYQGGDSVSATATVIQNNSFPGWTLGCEINTDKENSQGFYIDAIRDIIAGFRIALRYHRASPDVQQIVPSLMYGKTIGDFSINAQIWQYIGDAPQSEIWGGITYSPQKDGLNFGVQGGAYEVSDATYWYFRAPCIAYRFSNGLGPFIWYQHTQNNENLKTDCYVVGFDFTF